jgi:prepilin-type processing-associated H-X9-DG protein/prepilin-type N-terminal cleavage/methylation domain-containing protein
MFHFSPMTTPISHSESPNRRNGWLQGFDSLKLRVRERLRHELRDVRNARRGSAGFTLVELLVVIGVIAVLAAMMLPMMSSARDRARQVHCLSNQKQLVNAFTNYSSDWDGVLPRWWTPTGGPRTSTLGLRAGQRDWAIDVLPYVQDERIYNCPSRKLLRGYAINLWLAVNTGFPLSDIPANSSSRMVMFTEIAGKPPVPGVYDFVDRSTPERWPIDARFNFDPRHNGGANVAFVDGHAKWIPSSNYTRWPTTAPRYKSVSEMGEPAGGTPVGTYWWPSETSPPG